MMRFMRDSCLLRAASRSRNNTGVLCARDASKQKSARAHRIWNHISIELGKGAEVLADFEKIDDLKRYLHDVVGVANQIRSAIKSREAKG